jgi:hypothetical protein
MLFGFGAMLPDLRLLVIATVSTFVVTVGAGLFASIRLLPEPLSVHGDRNFGDDSPINRIAVSWPDPSRPSMRDLMIAPKQAKPLDLPPPAPKAEQTPSPAIKEETATIPSEPSQTEPPSAAPGAPAKPADTQATTERSVTERAASEQARLSKEKEGDGLAKKNEAAKPVAEQSAAATPHAQSTDSLSDGAREMTGSAKTETAPAPVGATPPKFATRSDPATATDASETPAILLPPERPKLEPHGQPKVEKKRPEPHVRRRRVQQATESWSNNTNYNSSNPAADTSYNYFIDRPTRGAN